MQLVEQRAGAALRGGRLEFDKVSERALGSLEQEPGSLEKAEKTADRAQSGKAGTVTPGSRFLAMRASSRARSISPRAFRAKARLA